ncbi:MAG: DUF2071 domain-containing protein [Planctomycetota bacterium]|nr:DUF2071 domain-containing protein [Planctomycetota bacterium]
MASPFLTAEWTWLVMLNWELDPALLRPIVPAGTELDLHAGRALASVVGFHFGKTRVLGLPIPFHCNFEEVNLRFYVRREARGEVRRGVVFIRELVPRWAVAWVARTVYNEQYASVPMGHSIERGAPPAASYRWTWRGKPFEARVRGMGEPSVPAEGSEASFIAEHYWGYTRQRDGSTLEYQVEHPAWRVWAAGEAGLSGDAEACYPGFGKALAGPPASAFLAEGSAVTVRKGVPLGT